MIKYEDIICIVCPKGCRLKVAVSNDEENFSISGEGCKRGVTYGIKELTNPTRTLTSTIKVDSNITPRLPVKTDTEIPKPMIFDVVSHLKNLSVSPPINVGDIIVENILDTGANIVSCKKIT